MEALGVPLGPLGQGRTRCPLGPGETGVQGSRRVQLGVLATNNVLSFFFLLLVLGATLDGLGRP